MLPFYYRMTRFAPSVGTPETLEVLPIRPVGDRTVERVQAPSDQNLFPAKSDVNLAAKPIPVFSDQFADSSKSTPLISPESFHLDPIWAGSAPSWSEVPRSIIIASDGTSVSEPAIEAGKFLAAQFHASHEICNFTADASVEIAKRILRRAHESKASLLILGTHHRKEKDRVTAGSVAEIVLKEAACPVLLVPQAWDWGKIHRILIPIDVSFMAYPEIVMGTHLAHYFGAELWVLHLFTQGKEVASNIQKMSVKMSSLKWNLLEEREGTCQKGIADSILEFTRGHSLDLILMGTRSEIIHDQILPSSVCLEVLRRTSCPLWVMHIP